MNKIKNPSFDWIDEVHKVLIQSLTTSFGLDFLLLEDKKGGDVDTINKVREYQREIKDYGSSEIHVSTKTQQSMDSKGNNIEQYNSTLYHKNKNYIDRGKIDKEKHDKGELEDKYRNKTISRNEKRQLDHVVSASETHNDAGRILSGIDGNKIANRETNFVSTHWYINNRKSNHSVEKFVNEVVPRTIQQEKDNISRCRSKLDSTPDNTPELRDKKREIEGEIRNHEARIEALESINKEKMLEADKLARESYNQEINFAYYTSSKFFGSTALSAANAGMRMGLRQALGLVMAEIWFELKDRISEISHNLSHNFNFNIFISQIGDAFKSIWERIKVRFKELLSIFKDGAISGALSSATTTIFNIFLTSTKLVGKLIRETWNSLVQAAKLLFFNPQSLPLGDLIKEVLRIFSLGVATFLSTMLNQYLNGIFTFPFGTEIAAFISALTTGIMTIGLGYFFDHSAVMQKIWSFLNMLRDKYEDVKIKFREINTELDCYLKELTAVEFNMDANQLLAFADSLYTCNTEYERTLILNAEIKRRNIELPFDATNIESTKNWLADLAKK